MIIKEAVYKTCDECGARKFVANPEHGCDYCEKFMERDEYPLSFTVFFEEGTREYDCCSWRCFFAMLRKATKEQFSFVSLPTFNERCEDGRTLTDFWECITT